MSYSTSNILSQIEQAQATRSNADFFPALLGNYEEDVIEGNLPLLLYGAGSAGQNLAELLLQFDVPICCFCDTCEDITGEKIVGLDVISIEQLKEKYLHSVIIVSSNTYKDEIKERLCQIGCNRIITLDDPIQCFFYTQFNKWQLSQKELEEQSESVDKVYGQLSDEISKQLFIRRIALFSGFPSYQAYRQYVYDFAEKCCLNNGVVAYASDGSEHYEDRLYFNNDVIKLQQNEMLLDAGAYDGGTCDAFLDKCDQEKISNAKVICVEADNQNYQRLIARTSKYDNVECHFVGLWSSTSQLYFEGTNTGISPDTARLLTEKELAEKSYDKNLLQLINVRRIDDIFKDYPISFIKMDIEGAEYEALIGAKSIIQTQTPKLAISIYHNKDDLFKIPALIHSLCPKYKFYIRQFSNHLSEMVLLAVVI